MSLLFRVLHAVHARGTHHKLALDGVARLTVPAADAWQRVFLKHHEAMLTGAKAPDDTFKDFTNHVLHPRDNWWGGAPKKARSWYDELVAALTQQDWPRAAYNAGVLSHYLTDPLQPFHTGQTEAENSIHRAFEWSVSNAYGVLMTLVDPAGQVALVRPDAATWLEAMVADGAGQANTHYEKLIAHFDIHRAVVDPASGLDIVARRIIARQLDRAAALVAFVLDQAIVESGASAPDVALGLDTLLATIKIPAKMWAKRLENAEDRRLVERMYDELKQTGTVETNLPADDRAVRAAFAAEVLAKQVPTPASAVFSAPAPVSIAKAATPVIDRSASEPVPVALPEPLPAAAPVLQALAPLRPAAKPVEHRPETAARARLYLTDSAPVVDAPSIGPKMAERLQPLGIATVADLLTASPDDVATRLDSRGIDAATVRDWQDQARLVCTVPSLRGTHAQLLVGAGFRSRDALVAAEADVLCPRVLAFATSAGGQRILRDGEPPDIEKIKTWLDSARGALAA